MYIYIPQTDTSKFYIKLIYGYATTSPFNSSEFEVYASDLSSADMYHIRSRKSIMYYDIPYTE